MALVDLADFVAGERVTAAKLNANTTRAFSALVTGKPFCHVLNDATQPVSSTVNASAVLLVRVVEDSDSMAETASSRLIIRTPGIWRFTAQMTWATNATGYRYAAIMRAGATNALAVATGPPANGAITRFNFSSPPVRLNVFDSVQLWAAQNSGTTLNTDTSHGGVFLAAEWLRA